MPEVKIFERPKSMTDVSTHYCPGCTHGIVHRLVAEVIDELKIQEKTVGVAPVGCAVLMYNYINTDMYEAAHGRAPAVATGCKRVRPDLTVFTYQGDGDLASIGAAEIVHAANRGENITVIFINNAIYGMTGGQMAPTTLINQKTTNMSLWKRSQGQWLSHKDSGNARNFTGSRLYSSRHCSQAEVRHEGKGSDQEGIPNPDRRKGLFIGRGALHLSDELGHASRGGLKVVGREHDPLLSPGRV